MNITIIVFTLVATWVRPRLRAWRKQHPKNDTFQSEDELIDICSAPNTDVAIKVDEAHAYLTNRSEAEPASLIVDGAALNTIISDEYGEELKWKLSEIGECCETVIACRWVK